MSSDTTKPLATYADVPFVERQVAARLSEVMASNDIDPPESAEWTAQAQAIEDTIAEMKADHAEAIAGKDAEIASLQAEVDRLSPYYSTMSNVKQLYNTFYSAGTSLTEVTIYCPNATSMQYAFKYSYVQKVKGYYGGTSMQYAFQYAYATSIDLSELEAPNLTAFTYVFQYAQKVKTINAGSLVTAKTTSLSYAFYGTSIVETLDISCWDTSGVTNFGYLFYNCNNLKYVIGTLSVEALSSTSTSYWNNYAMYSVTKLRRIHIKGIGTKSAVTSFRAVATNWGYEDGTEADEGNLRSLVDSLVNDTYDRASAGYSTCTLYLHANCAARLTTEQKAAITAKGYTISTVSTSY